MEKKMTPCEKFGYKVGDRFEVTDEGKNVADWGLGTIIILHADDGTNATGFRKSGEPWNHDFVLLDGVKPVDKTLKTGDTIERDGKKYRVTLEEIPQYEFKPGMMCQVTWDGSETCVLHSDCTRVVYLGNKGMGREEIAYTAEGGNTALAIGYVNTSALRPE